MRLDKRWWWAGGGVAALGLVAIVIVTSGGGGGVPTAAATSAVQRGTVSAEVSAAGTVQSASTRGLSFGSAGTVTELNVRAGDLVTEGQVLARIDPSDAQAALDSAANRVDDAAQALSKAQQTAALPPCTTAAPTTAAPTTAAATPGPSGGPAQSSQPRATATTPCNSRVTTSDPLLSAQQQYNNAQLSLTQAQVRLSGTTITAPVAGRVLSVGGTVGSRVSPGGTGFVVLGDVSSLTVRAEFTEADVGRLAVGQVAAITLPDRLEPVSGKVSQIDPAGTITNRLVRYGVVISFDAVPGSVLLGQSATVLVTTQSVENVLYVASAAVVPTGDGVGTVTVRAGGQDQTRTVRFGLRGDQYTEVSDGVSEGEVLVIP